MNQEEVLVYSIPGPSLRSPQPGGRGSKWDSSVDIYLKTTSGGGGGPLPAIPGLRGTCASLYIGIEYTSICFNND